MAAASIPNSRLKHFERDVDAGNVLRMLDVPAPRVDELRELVHRPYPDASGGAMEPTMPALPYANGG